MKHLTLRDEFKAEHRDKLKEIYKKLFGYYRTEDKEIRAEIEAEATSLAIDLSNEMVRVVERIDIYDNNR